MKRCAEVVIPIVCCVVLLGSGCRHRSPTPSAVEPTPPPPAPPPAVEAPPAPDEYTRVRNASVDEINAMRLFRTIHFDLDDAHVRESDRLILIDVAAKLRRFD